MLLWETLIDARSTFGFWNWERIELERIKYSKFIFVLWKTFFHDFRCNRNLRLKQIPCSSSVKQMNEWQSSDVFVYLIKALSVSRKVLRSATFSIFIKAFPPFQFENLNKSETFLCSFREMKLPMNLSSPPSYEKCHSSESRHLSVHEYLSENDYLRDDAPVRSPHHHQNHDAIRRIPDTFTIDIILHQVSRAAMSLVIQKNHCR